MMSGPRADNMIPPSGADFEAFPPTVKRKYFSTLERLRYAQGQPLQEAPAAMHVFRPKSSGTPKQKSAHLRRPSLFQLRSSPRHGRDHVPESPSLAGQMSHDELHWYQNLPEKIKRNHFTFEERHAFARNEPVVPDAAEELFYRLGGRHANKSLPSLSSCSETGSAKEEMLNTPMDMNDAVFDTFRMLEGDSPLDLTLDEYHNHVADTANVTQIVSPTTKKAHQIRSSHSTPTQRPRPSLDRARTFDATPSRDSSEDSSLADLPIQVRGRSSSKPSLPSSSLSRPSTPKRPTLLERRSVKRASSHAEIPPVPLIDPEAAHVSDPATRLKLKLYLSSAAKFDEALEFGFPSLGTSTPSRADFLSKRLSVSTATSHRRSLSAGALQSMHSYQPMRRSLSTSRTSARESVAIGTTFFYDDYDSESEGESEAEDGDVDTVRDSASINNAGMESDGTAVDVDIHTGTAELPAELPAEPLTPPPGNYLSPHTSPSARNSISSTNASTIQPLPITFAPYPPQMPRLSRSISLKPRLQTSDDMVSMTALPQVPQSAKDFTALSRVAAAELRSPQTPLKPWVEPTDMLGDREMTLRLTLTRKDLRADESLIYPDGGTGSWNSPGLHVEHVPDGRDVSSQGKWRFWPKRR